ncbi:16854_t:CDS:1, partial [Funneliformis caledonium]
MSYDTIKYKRIYLIIVVLIAVFIAVSYAYPTTELNNSISILQKRQDP